jgi:hypothetical protein
MIPFQLQRLVLVMEPEPGNPLEAEGGLTRLPPVALTVSFTSSCGWSRHGVRP